MLKEIKWEFVPDIKSPEPDKEPAVLRPYLDFYGLKKSPFTITPDPEFLYSSSTHKTALEDILYGIEAGMGFIVLTGEVGTGKTTLCRAILDNLEGKAETVYIINPSLSGMEIIEAILDDLDIDHPANLSKKLLIDLLNRFLLNTTGKRPVVIIIDDAQTMTPDGLENLRLLSNLETDKRKLLQIVLAGQPELQKILSQPELRQLRQRISISSRLGLLGYEELKQYISLRLFVAGDRGHTGFTEGAIKKIYMASHGIPRLINIICDYALMAGYVSNSPVVRKRDAVRAIGELRQQAILNKPFLSGLQMLYPLKKRIAVELTILLLCLMLLAVSYDKDIFNINNEQNLPVNKNELSGVTYLPLVEPVSNIVHENSEETRRVADERAVNSEAALTDMANNSIEKNYIIQLFSYKTLKEACRGGESLRAQGLDVHWNSVHMTTNGTWYRVYQGGFESEKDAKAYMDEAGLKDGVILYAPWTVVITPKNGDETIEDIKRSLIEKGYDPLIHENVKNETRLILGAYISLERAVRASREIIDLGYDAKPMER
jgi:general secretion pathway protein A